MKGDSEARVRKALGDIDRRPLVIRLLDQPGAGQNWKPADYIVLDQRGPWLFEVKDTPAAGRWPLSDLRPAQVLGIREAHRVGVPYALVIWWRRRKRWTISDGWAVLEAMTGLEKGRDLTSVTYEWLCSVAGIDSDDEHLSSTLRALLDGEVM